MMILAGAITMLVGLFVGFVIGFVYGAKAAHKLLEREGRLRPTVPPAVARPPFQ